MAPITSDCGTLFPQAEQLCADLDQELAESRSKEVVRGPTAFDLPLPSP